VKAKVTEQWLPIVDGTKVLFVALGESDDVGDPKAHVVIACSSWWPVCA
jgi:hypothetical protein